MYSLEQEEFWSLLEEHIAIQEQKRGSGAVYDFDLLYRDKENMDRLRAFKRQHSGKSFYVFRPEDLARSVRSDLPALDDVLPISLIYDRPDATT
jgi:hypothetical protein